MVTGADHDPPACSRCHDTGRISDQFQRRSPVDGKMRFISVAFACSCLKGQAHMKSHRSFDLDHLETHGADQRDLDYERDRAERGAEWASEWWGQGVDISERGRARAAGIREAS